MKKIIDYFNNLMYKLAEILADSLASMTMFWIITLLVLIPLFWSQPAGGVAWMQYIVAVFFQGVALPVLGYTAKLSGKRTDEIIDQIEKMSVIMAKQTKHIEELSLLISIQTQQIEKNVDQIEKDLEK